MVRHKLNITDRRRRERFPDERDERRPLRFDDFDDDGTFFEKKHHRAIEDRCESIVESLLVLMNNRVPPPAMQRGRGGGRERFHAGRGRGGPPMGVPPFVPAGNNYFNPNNNTTGPPFNRGGPMGMYPGKMAGRGDPRRNASGRGRPFDSNNMHPPRFPPPPPPPPMMMMMMGGRGNFQSRSIPPPPSGPPSQPFGSHSHAHKMGGIPPPPPPPPRSMLQQPGEHPLLYPSYPQQHHIQQHIQPQPPVMPSGQEYHPMIPQYPMQQVPQAGAVPPPPPPAAVRYTQAQIDAAWKLFKDQNSGKDYYANALIQKSQFDKPACLVAAEQQAQQPEQQQASSTTTTTNTSAPSSSAWKEYTDATTGKLYYSNGITTTWDKPKKLTATTTTATRMPSTVTTSEPTTRDSDYDKHQQQGTPASKRKRKPSTDFASKEEAVSAFKGLLLDKDIAPTLKWNDVTKICQGDSRWDSCQNVLSTGERKQALAEYQTKRSNELRDLERQERARAKHVFAELLLSVVPTLPNFSAWNTRLADVRDALTKDDRFHVVAEESTRENLFMEFCEEYRKREERKKSNKKRKAQDNFMAFLTEKNEEGTLLYSSTWSSFLALLQEPDLVDKRFAASPDLSEEDRQLLFADYVLELQRSEDDKRRRIREATIRTEKEQRDALLNELSEMAVKGKLVPASRWRAVEEQISAHPSFGPVKAQDREAPREVFEAFVTQWNAQYRKDRLFLSQIIYPSSKSDEIVKKETTFDEFSSALLEKASEQSQDAYKETRQIINQEAPVSSARLYFNELSMRAKGISGPPIMRRGSALRGNDSDSSEDEGEIIEDGITEILNL